MSLKYGFAYSQYGKRVIQASAVLDLMQKTEKTQTEDIAKENPNLKKLEQLASACHTGTQISGELKETETAREFLRNQYNVLASNWRH